MIISFLICTYNRCESLRDTLVSLTKQQLPAGVTAEIVVVDNNSPDRTRAVVQEFARDCRFPVQYVFEKSQGVGYARNTGLLAVRGKYVLITDDDTIADSDWAAYIYHCFEQTGADMVGGKLVPLWLTPRPEWLTNDLLGPMPSIDYGPVRKRWDASCSGFFLTANCSLRRSSIEKFGIFNVTLGRRAASLIGGEDAELFERWNRRDAVIYYEPAALMHHKVGADRVTPDFYRKWFIDIGYTQAHQTDWKWHHAVSILPAWRWKKLVETGIRYFRSRIGASAAVRLQSELWWKFQASYLKERLVHWLGWWFRIGSPSCPFSKAH
jgi:glycosyltransferase involved in cell wall biosynthesis